MRKRESVQTQPRTQPIQARHFHLQGKVQGVGFRPFVYRLAVRLGLRGWVSNGRDGVHIHVEGPVPALKQFALSLRRDHPPIARIQRFQEQACAPRGLEAFTIRESQASGPVDLQVLPDLDVCEACLRELQQPGNRRAGYPFITCTDCGPRFSIMTGLPYDRENTTMAAFTMCTTCSAEYQNPEDRRFYSQTNSCPRCGITLSLCNREGDLLARDGAALKKAVQTLHSGGIVALKGLGGYMLCCDATNPDAVARLRQRKHRPNKPFALMLPGLDMAEKLVHLRPVDRRWLTCREKPIVILPRKPGERAVVPGVAPDQDTLGIMLPYTPLHALLMEKLQRPMVATSGNISGSPILYREPEVFHRLGAVADLFLVHNREIAMPQDDSVLRLSPFTEQPIFLRRARGFAPLLPSVSCSISREHALLALGAHQKSTLALSSQGNLFLSQYLGDLEDFDSQQHLSRMLQAYQQLFGFEPTALAVDSHPQYASSALGRALARSRALPLFEVQHHRAHFWALLAEHNWLRESEPVLGVIWDGTGWGEDGQIWGSESFLFAQKQMPRIGHLEPFPLLLGDKAAREPRLAALGLCAHLDVSLEALREKFTGQEWSIYQQLWQKARYYWTTSMGRLFDAVACLLGLADRVSFEGQAAMQLERLAWQAVSGPHDLLRASTYPLRKAPHSQGLALRPIFQGICTDLQAGVPGAEIALRFHATLVEWVRQMLEERNLHVVGFSGGVFQNALLVDLLQLRLGGRYRLLFHQMLPPNDENIALGQLIQAAVALNAI